MCLSHEPGDKFIDSFVERPSFISAVSVMVGRCVEGEIFFCRTNMIHPVQCNSKELKHSAKDTALRCRNALNGEDIPKEPGNCVTYSRRNDCTGGYGCKVGVEGKCYHPLGRDQL